MIIYKIIATCIVSLLLITLLKNTSPNFAIITSIVTGIMITIYISPYIKEIILTFSNIGGDIKELQGIFGKIIKVICVATVCEFASQICLDAGENFLSHKVSMAGKLVILGVVSTDVIQFIDYIVGLIKNL